MTEHVLGTPGRLLFRWHLAAYLCTGFALLLVLAITTWGAYVDFREVRLALLHGETNRLRSHAVRTVSRVQDQLATAGSLANAVQKDSWLRGYWDRWIPGDESRLFAAIVDRSGRILMHSNRNLEGGKLASGWYDRAILEIDEDGDVVETRAPALTGGKPCIDVTIPILYREQEVGDYHSGLDQAWFDAILAEKNASTRSRWIGIFAMVLLVVAVAGVSLIQILRRTMMLREAVELARVRQFAELGELAAGIAHEIRNPINAIRLNLHALQRMQADGNKMEGEASTVIVEANREIERVEGLMRIMLGYARPEKPNNVDLDLGQELETVAQFLRPVMDRDKVSIHLQLPGSPLFVHIDRNRFRQILLNLLNNAKDAVGRGGRIDVRLLRRKDWVEVIVADSGPGVPVADRERIFDPFYSTKELGTGLGLALVKRFVEEAEGRVVCEEDHGGGACFRLSFPAVLRESRSSN